MSRRFPMVLRLSLFFSSLVAILFFLFLGIIAVEVRSSLNTMTDRQYTDLVSAHSQQLSEMINKTQTFLTVYCNLPQIKSLDKKQISQVVNDSVGVTPPEAAGFFFADEKGDLVTNSGTTANVSDRDYFKAILADHQGEFIGSPILSRTLNQPVIVVAKAVYGHDGAIKGLMGAQLLLDKLSVIATAIKIGKSGFGWIVDGNGTVIAHPDQKLVLKLNLKDPSAQGTSGMGDFVNAFTSKFKGTSQWTGADGTVMKGYFSLVKQTPGWHLILSLPQGEVNETTDNLLILLSLFLVVGVAISIVLSVLLARAVAKPIRLSAQKFRLLAEGEADLTIKLDLQRNDEIGDMVKDFNAFIAKLHQIVSSVKQAQEKLRSIGEELKNSAQDSASAVQQITTQSEKVNTLIQKQGNSVNESSAAIEEITKNIEFLDKLIGTQAQEISQASAAIEEMIGNITSISSSIGKMSREFTDLTVEAKEGKANMDTTLQGIQLISERSNSLVEANKVISSIAARTNLLAMNAAIEAAHAGEYGRGFSVVASEIRALAENASNQSRAIAKEIGTVKSTIDEMVKTSVVTGESFSKVNHRVEGIEILAREISQAMAEQNQASKEVLEALRGIKDGTFQVQNGSKEMNTGNAMILKEMENLRESSNEILIGMVEMVQGSANIQAATQKVLSIATQTQETIESVEDNVGRFKI